MTGSGDLLRRKQNFSSHKVFTRFLFRSRGMSEVSWGWIAMMMFMGTCTTAFLWQNAAKIVKNWKSGLKKEAQKGVPEEFPDPIFTLLGTRSYRTSLDCPMLRERAGQPWPFSPCQICKESKNQPVTVDHPGSTYRRHTQAALRAVVRYGVQSLPDRWWEDGKCFLCGDSDHQHRACPLRTSRQRPSQTARPQGFTGGEEVW